MNLRSILVLLIVPSFAACNQVADPAGPVRETADGVTAGRYPLNGKLGVGAGLALLGDQPVGGR